MATRNWLYQNSWLLLRRYWFRISHGRRPLFITFSWFSKTSLNKCRGSHFWLRSDCRYSYLLIVRLLYGTT